MSASDHLGPQWFHGTDAELNPGQLIHPASAGYAQQTGGSADHAHMTRSTYQAGVYATRAHRTPGNVYRVEPTGPSEPDPQHTSSDDLGSVHMRSSSPLRVIGLHKQVKPLNSSDDADLEVI